MPDCKALVERLVLTKKSDENKINRINLLFSNYGYTNQIANGKQYIKG
jgi:hypothetical protein